MTEPTRTGELVTLADAVNTDENPHEPWPIEALCCSFHYPAEPPCST